MISAEIAAKKNGPSDFLRQIGARTVYLLFAMPLAIFSFVVTVTLLALGIGLMPLGIGFFIYWFALASAAHYQYSFVGTALGVIFLIIGMTLMPKVLRMATSMLQA
jgi:hypothetical protein